MSKRTKICLNVCLVVWNKKNAKKKIHLTRVTVGGGEAKIESGHTFLRFFVNPSLSIEINVLKLIRRWGPLRRPTSSPCKRLQHLGKNKKLDQETWLCRIHLDDFYSKFPCSFFPLFRCYFVPLFLYSFVTLLLCSFVPLFLCSFVPLFLCSFVPLFLSKFYLRRQKSIACLVAWSVRTYEN